MVGQRFEEGEKCGHLHVGQLLGGVAADGGFHRGALPVVQPRPGHRDVAQGWRAEPLGRGFESWRKRLAAIGAAVRLARRGRADIMDLAIREIRAAVAGRACLLYTSDAADE